MTTTQLERWTGDFGNAYHERNPKTTGELEELYRAKYFISRTDLNKMMLNNIPRDIRILEIGCGTGLQLRILQDMGFTKLCGIEPNAQACAKAQEIEGLLVVQKDLFSLDPHDRFDMVMTSGLLIHIPPADLSAAMDVIYRTSEKYIYGFEYYAKNHSVVDYRGNIDMLWCGPFAQMFLNQYHDLEPLDRVFLTEHGTDHVDAAYLLRKP